MEIPTEEILKSLRTVITRSNESTLMATIATINAQSKEILELQATICRLKREMQIKEEVDRIVYPHHYQ